MNVDDLRLVLPEFLKNPPVTLNQDRDEVQALFDKLCLLVFNDERDHVPHYVLTEEEYKILKDIGFNNISDFSGQYADLIGIPDIPERVEDLEDGSDYVTKNYLSAYIGAPIPRKVSDLENDLGYITSEAIPEIPRRTSELENDSGFLTYDYLEGIANDLFPTKLSQFENDIPYARKCDVISYERLSELEINFGSEDFESTLIKLAKVIPNNPDEGHVIYRGVCYNQEVLNLFAARNTNDCYIEIDPIEQTPSKKVFEVTVTNLDTNPYRFVRLYEISTILGMVRITNRSPQWLAVVTELTEDRVKELILEVLTEQGLIPPQ